MSNDNSKRDFKYHSSYDFMNEVDSRPYEPKYSILDRLVIVLGVSGYLAAFVTIGLLLNGYIDLASFR